MIKINVTHTVIVEGLLKSDGLAGSTSRGGGSGGCIKKVIIFSDSPFWLILTPFITEIIRDKNLY
jgi:hypothetical protein